MERWVGGLVVSRRWDGHVKGKNGLVKERDQGETGEDRMRKMRGEERAGYRL